jgi:hypothetical protein
VQWLRSAVTINATTTYYEVRVFNVLDGPVSFTVAGVHTTFAKKSSWHAGSSRCSEAGDVRGSVSRGNLVNGEEPFIPDDVAGWIAAGGAQPASSSASVNWLLYRS